MNIRKMTDNKKIFKLLFYFGIFIAFLIPKTVGMAANAVSITRAPGWNNILVEKPPKYQEYRPEFTKDTKIYDMSPGMKALNGEHGHVRLGNTNQVVEDPDTLVYPTDQGKQWIVFSNVGKYPSKEVAHLKVTITPRSVANNPKLSWIGVSGSRFLDMGIERGSRDVGVKMEYFVETLNGPNGKYISGNYTYIFTDDELAFVRYKIGADETYSVDQSYQNYDIDMPTLLTYQGQILGEKELMMTGDSFKTYPVQRQFAVICLNNDFEYKLRSHANFDPTIRYPQILKYGYVEDRPIDNPTGKQKTIRKVTQDTSKNMSYEFTQIMPVRTLSDLSTKTEWLVKLDTLPSHLKHGEDWSITDNAGRNRLDDFIVKKIATDEYKFTIKNNKSLDMYGYDYSFELPIEITDEPINTRDLVEKNDGQYLKAKGAVDFFVDDYKQGSNIGFSTDINVGYKVKYRYLLNNQSNMVVPGTDKLKKEDWGYLKQSFKAIAPTVDNYKLKKVEPTGADTNGFTLDYHPNGDKEVTFYYEERSVEPEISWNSPTNSEPRLSTKNTTIDLAKINDFYKEDIYVNTANPNDIYDIVTKKNNKIIAKSTVGPTGIRDEYRKNSISIPKESLDGGMNEFSVEMYETKVDQSDPKNSLSTLLLKTTANGTLMFEKVPTELKWTERKIRETKGIMDRDIGNDMEFIIKDSRGTNSRDFSLWVSAEYQANVTESPFSLKWKEQNNKVVDLNAGGGAHKILSHTMGKETDFKMSWDTSKGVLLSSDTYVLAGDYNNLMTVVWTLSDTESAN